MLTTFISLFFFLGCGSSDTNQPPPPTYPVAEQADGSQFSNTQSPGFGPDGRGVTENVAGGGTLLARHKKLGAVPQNAIALWIEAAIRAQQGENEGWAALTELTLPLREDDSWRSHGRNTYFMKAITEKNPAFRSFIVGSTPENGYAVDLDNIQIKVAYENKKDVRGRKFMIVSSGASMPRPIYVKQSTKSKLFYVTEYSSMYVDVQPAIDPDEETFK